MIADAVHKRTVEQLPCQRVLETAGTTLGKLFALLGVRVSQAFRAQNANEGDKKRRDAEFRPTKACAL
jgi:hypothetical protein